MATTRETPATASSEGSSARPAADDDEVTQRLAPPPPRAARAAPTRDGPPQRTSPAESRQVTPRPPQPDAPGARSDGRPLPQQPAQPGQQKIAVPERPKLAPGVSLAGQMRESAFKNPPWLIERDGAGYVQVTELLYRIAEQCDGRQTLEQIAAAVSEQTGRNVSADNVKVLVGTQLLLKGLVQTADGKVVGGAGARSLLAISLRNTMIGPEQLERPAAVFQWLFWPPVMIGMIALAVGAVAWLLLVHGLAAGGRQALYQPGLLLIALGLTALAAGFHELGHAAALRYGGGKPKGMGVGFYLVYPAFYTDVSDNYRLPRWSRVRTDLGGVFFHLIFALGIIGLYLATGFELVLVAVPLLLLDALRQLMPFIRLDGYWTLADVTGVPDFLSYVGAFIRRFLPGQDGSTSAKLPELKWWGTAAFGAYVVVALPILGFLLFTMVRTAPTVLATGWDSASQQAGALAEAGRAGDLLGMASASAQLLILALPTVGLVYSLGRFGTRIALAIWRWSSPTPTRRLIGGLGTLGALGLVAYLWAPQLPFVARPGPLYEPTRASFVPIPADARGTLFDTVGLPQPEWTTGGPTTDGPAPAPSPSPGVFDLGPGPVASPAAVEAAATAEASATAAASATAQAEASPTDVPSTRAPAATPVPARPAGAPTVAPGATARAVSTPPAAPLATAAPPRSATQPPAATTAPAQATVAPVQPTSAPAQAPAAPARTPNAAGQTPVATPTPRVAP